MYYLIFAVYVGHSSLVYFIVRRYASAVYAVVMCLSARPSVCPSVGHTLALYQKG